MYYEDLNQVPTDLVVTDKDGWIHEYRHGAWGYRMPIMECVSGIWCQTGDYQPWTALAPDEIPGWSDAFGPFEYTEV